MNVEQTSQLIQLVFNSVILVTACVMLTNSLSLRHLAIVNRLRGVQYAYFERVQATSSPDAQRELLHLKTQLRQLRQQYRHTHYSLMAAHGALLFAGSSTLVIAVRTLVNANWLIETALMLFVGSVAVLLIGVGLTLLTLSTTHRSLWRELTPLLDLSSVIATATQPAIVRRSRRSFPLKAGAK